MVKIIIKPGRDNAKNRYRARRKAARDAAEQERSIERKIVISMSGGVAGALAEKAVSGLEKTDKEIAPEQVSNGDAIFKVVNHAHQRNPKKKWS